MSRFSGMQENTALARGVATPSPACALGESVWFLLLTTTDAQRAAVRLGK